MCFLDKSSSLRMIFFPHPPLLKLTNKNEVSIIDVALEDGTVLLSGPFG